MAGGEAAGGKQFLETQDLGGLILILNLTRGLCTQVEGRAVCEELFPSTDGARPFSQTYSELHHDCGMKRRSQRSSRPGSDMGSSPDSSTAALPPPIPPGTATEELAAQTPFILGTTRGRKGKRHPAAAPRPGCPAERTQGTVTRS